MYRLDDILYIIYYNNAYLTRNVVPLLRHYVLQITKIINVRQANLDTSLPYLLYLIMLQSPNYKFVFVCKLI